MVVHINNLLYRSPLILWTLLTFFGNNANDNNPIGITVNARPSECLWLMSVSPIQWARYVALLSRVCFFASFRYCFSLKWLSCCSRVISCFPSRCNYCNNAVWCRSMKYLYCRVCCFRDVFHITNVSACREKANFEIVPRGSDSGHYGRVSSISHILSLMHLRVN